MNQYLSFIKSKANFNNPPVDFDTWGQYDYDVLKHEKYCYNTYRHFLKSYLVNPKENTVFDINCGKGYGISHLEKEFGFKNLKGYDKTRIYAYLAERYLSFWFKKYTKYKEHPWIFIDV